MLGEFPDDLKGVEVNNEEQENISYAGDIISYGEWSMFLYLSIIISILVGLISIYYRFPTTTINGIGELTKAENKKLKFVHFSINLSKWQKFFKLSMQVMNSTKDSALINGLISVKCITQKQTPVELTSPINNLSVSFDPSEKSSNLVPIFEDSYFKYDNIDVTVWVTQESLTNESFRFVFEAGNQRYVPIEILLKALSPIMLLVIAVIFWSQARQYEKLSLEEKLTIFLLLATILLFDPISLFYHGGYSELLTRISRDLYISAFAYFAGAIFVGFGDYNNRIFIRSFLPPASAAVFAISIVIIDAIRTPPHRTGIYGQIPDYCIFTKWHLVAFLSELVIIGVCAVLAIFAASREHHEESRIVSGTERVIVYLNIIAFALIAFASSIVVPIFWPNIGGLTIFRLLPGTVAIVFALIMTHCHLRLTDFDLLQPATEFDPGPIGVEEDQEYLQREV